MRTKAEIIIEPKEGDVLQLHSDLWLIFENNNWREMTVAEQQAHD